MYDLFVLDEERDDGNNGTTDLLSHIGDEISLVIKGNRGKKSKKRGHQDMESDMDDANDGDERVEDQMGSLVSKVDDYEEQVES